MPEHGSDAYAFLAVTCLPLLIWALSRPPVWSRIRARLEPVALRLWQQLILPEPADDMVLRRWAAERLEQLRSHLERVRRLVLDDEHMTATRQVGNRLAHERLVRDVREAEDALAACRPLEPWLVPAPPTLAPMRPARSAYCPPASTVVEVIEFGPSGRWI